MTRIQLSCYALIASAVVLSAMVVGAADRLFARESPQSTALLESQAFGGMVVNRDSTTMLTAEGVGTDDFVYVLERDRLLCYSPSQRGRDILELFAAIDVSERIRLGMQKFGGADNGRGRGGR